MEIHGQNLTILDRDADPNSYFENLTDDELISIVQSLEDFEDVSSALTELSSRDKNAETAELSFEILEKDSGDEYLQAVAFNLLYNSDVKKAVKIIETRISNASPALLGEILSNLASNSSQPFESSLSEKLLRSVVDRFFGISAEDQKGIYDDYEFFAGNYKTRLT